jgi:hypothetical protein
MESVINTLIIALLGTGGAAFIWAVARSIIAWKNSAELREDKAVARLEKFEASCREDLEFERRVSAYWQRMAGSMEHVLIRNGLEVPPIGSPPQRGSARSV